MEINDKYYETISVRKSLYYDEINKTLDIVKKFIIREKRILVGGMSIDFALKIKGQPGIYDDDVLPDYDFYSPTHFQDAYHIAEWLYRIGFRGISVINALHPSTMKVRVNFNVVADITYIPSEIINELPVLHYRGFTIIHPHVQMIDQHRSLSYPYENTPWDTIMGKRPKNDMKRYDMFYAEYPLRQLNIADHSINLKSNEMPLELFKKQCLTGFFALNHWVQEAKKLGFKTEHNFGYYEISGDIIKYKIPIDSHGVSVYSDNMEEFYRLFLSLYNPKEKRFYNRFLDKLPRKVIMDNEWEILDNNQKIAAHKLSDQSEIYVANLQPVMMYLLTNYIILMKLKGGKRGFSFYMGYLECRNLVTWAANKYYSSGASKSTLEQFLPTHEVYGAREISESYIVSKHNFDIKNRVKSPDEKYKYSQPTNVYDRDMGRMSVPKSYFEFNINNSEVFKFDGGETEPFFN
jgi:Poly(A) polymerase catalytic subunit